MKAEWLKYSRAGVENKKIAKLLGFSDQHLYDVQNENPDFKLQIDEARAIANIDVEESLYNMAVGFHKTEEKVVVLSGGLQHQSTSETIEYEKYHPPQLAAAKHYLNNRNPDRWKEKAELNVKVTDLSDEELEAMAREILASKDKDEDEK